jgi:hypothetical protein
MIRRLLVLAGFFGAALLFGAQEKGQILTLPWGSPPPAGWISVETGGPPRSSGFINPKEDFRMGPVTVQRVVYEFGDGKLTRAEVAISGRPRFEASKKFLERYYGTPAEWAGVGVREAYLWAGKGTIAKLVFLDPSLENLLLLQQDPAFGNRTVDPEWEAACVFGEFLLQCPKRKAAADAAVQSVEGAIRARESSREMDMPDTNPGDAGSCLDSSRMRTQRGINAQLNQLQAKLQAFLVERQRLEKDCSQTEKDLAALREKARRGQPLAQPVKQVPQTE